MFFGEGKIGPMREMIVAENDRGPPQARLAKLLPLQREDFARHLRAMGGRPVTIRTIDPPLHEFLPHDEAGMRRAGAAPPASRVEAIKARIEELHESNPMLGHRGCRLGVTYPEITEMQARAIFEAAVDVTEEGHQDRARDDDPARRHQEGARPARPPWSERAAAEVMADAQGAR